MTHSWLSYKKPKYVWCIQHIHSEVDSLGGGQRGIEAFCQASGMCHTGMLTREGVARLYKEFETQGEEAF